VTDVQRIIARQSLILTETLNSFDVIATAPARHHGTGCAVRMGIARALQEFNPELRAKMKARAL